MYMQDCILQMSITLLATHIFLLFLQGGLPLLVYNSFKNKQDRPQEAEAGQLLHI